MLDWNAPSIAFYESLGARRKEGWLTMRLDGETLAALGRFGGGKPGGAARKT